MPVKSRVLSSGRWSGGESGYKVIVAVQQIGGYSRWGWPVYDGRMPACSPATAPLLQLSWLHQPPFKNMFRVTQPSLKLTQA
jgi:hypothetical protein